jgi:uncharacterized protein
LSGLSIIIPGGLLLGLAFGVLMQRTHYCTMGALSDFFLFGSTRRLRIFALALGTALIGTQGLIALGLMPRPPIAAPGLVAGLAALGGGTAFGFGMVLAGGCLSRNLVRFGAGSLSAGLVLLVLGCLALPVLILTTPLLTPPGPASPAGISALPIGLGAGAALLALALAEQRFRSNPRDIGTGLALGGLVGAGWAVSAGAPVGAGTSFNFIAGLSVAAPPLPTALFALATVPGVLAGAFLAARLGRQWRRDWFRDRSDLRRNLLGAALMGIGGGLAGGCTIGHGLSGLAVLSLISLLAVLGMAAGARWAIFQLETGRLLPLAGSTR